MTAPSQVSQTAQVSQRHRYINARRTSTAQLLQRHRRACHATADVSVSVATWSTTTRSRPASVVAASYAGRNAGAMVPGGLVCAGGISRAVCMGASFRDGTRAGLCIAQSSGCNSVGGDSFAAFFFGMGSSVYRLFTVLATILTVKIPSDTYLNRKFH